MCGLVGVVALTADRPSLSESAFDTMRDRLAHRGPDDAGTVQRGRTWLGHRRLSVIDPGPGGHQPMVTDDERFALVYNGELYNDRELRSTLAGEGVAFRSGCDTETLLLRLSARGESGLGSLRGMYSFAFHDREEGTVLLARDPLGIKPLYWAEVEVGGGGRELVFASEIPSILAHPSVSARPDPATISAYLSTIRTTLGERTMFEGVRTLLPGEWLVWSERTGELLRSGRERVRPIEGGDTRDVIAGSVASHLRSDVPLCTLLSGGLDSAICARVASDRLRETNSGGGLLLSFCAGAPEGGEIAGVPQSADFEHARLCAEAFGTEHHEAPVSRELFIERWGWMVGHLGVPLSTPNEVAIYEVARTLREQGCVVTLSGEGADELFGGYDVPLTMAAQAIAQADASETSVDHASLALSLISWTSLADKPRVLTDDAWHAARQDEELLRYLGDLAAGASAQTEDPIGVQLLLQQAMNLPGLLQRLDTSTMLASVEGRTPFADAGVAAHANGLPMSSKFDPADTSPLRTKRDLRRAFAADLPSVVVERPKASFPLPFQAWLGEMQPEVASLVRRSELLGSVLRPEAIELVAQQPGQAWALSWPAVNLALWGEAVFS
ncbi:MAG: asparagine synthase (glutamine-hydrolyzing) [Planctomycetota bacterium]